MGRPRKYHNTPTEYLGFLYDSKKEADYAMNLDLMMKGKVISAWNQQVRISFDVCVDGRLIARSKSLYLPQHPPSIHVYQHLCSYIVDFVVIHRDGQVELVEIKSEATRTAAWKLKATLLEATLLREHPNIKYTVVS